MWFIKDHCRLSRITVVYQGSLSSIKVKGYAVWRLQ